MPNWPEFDIKLQGRAIARYKGPKDHQSVNRLIDFFRKEQWRGKLTMDFTGNGGISDIVFDEVRRATEERQ